MSERVDRRPGRSSLTTEPSGRSPKVLTDHRKNKTQDVERNVVFFARWRIENSIFVNLRFSRRDGRRVGDSRGNVTLIPARPPSPETYIRDQSPRPTRRPKEKTGQQGRTSRTAMNACGPRTNKSTQAMIKIPGLSTGVLSKGPYKTFAEISHFKTSNLNLSNRKF